MSMSGSGAIEIAGKSYPVEYEYNAFIEHGRKRFRGSFTGNSPAAAMAAFEASEAILIEQDGRRMRVEVGEVVRGEMAQFAGDRL